jgi:hypothetical protein
MFSFFLFLFFVIYFSFIFHIYLILLTFLFVIFGTGFVLQYLCTGCSTGSLGHGYQTARDVDPPRTPQSSLQSEKTLAPPLTTNNNNTIIISTQHLPIPSSLFDVNLRKGKRCKPFMERRNRKKFLFHI